MNVSMGVFGSVRAAVIIVLKVAGYSQSLHAPSKYPGRVGLLRDVQLPPPSLISTSMRFWMVLGSALSTAYPLFMESYIGVALERSAVSGLWKSSQFRMV